MKKAVSLVLSLVLLVGLCSLTACGGEETTPIDEAVPSNGQNSTSAMEPNADSNAQQPTSEQNTHSEYVETYYIYAEQGCIVTWFDSKTGQFKYQAKCETCGQTAGGEHGGGLFLTSNGSSHNAGFTCTNANCSMWGKSQQAIIGCNVSGEWIEVDD